MPYLIVMLYGMARSSGTACAGLPGPCKIAHRRLPGESANSGGGGLGARWSSDVEQTRGVDLEQPSPGVMRTANATPQVAAGCLYLFALPFCAFGLFAAVRSIERLRAGDLPTAAYAAMFAIVFGGVGFGLVYAFRWSARSGQARDRLRE